MRNKNDDPLFGQGKGDYAYYEDTHDAKGNYTGGFIPFSGKLKNGGNMSAKPNQSYTQMPQQQQQSQMPMQQQAYPQFQQFQPYQPEFQGMPQQVQQPVQFIPYAGAKEQQYYEAPKPMPQQPKNTTLAPGNKYNNMVVYEPRTPADVQQLIDYLKRKEPAIVNLDSVDNETAQRVLDFLSGAVYALSGSIHRISGNIFLLTPEGVVITAPV